ncbi:MAG: polyamine aminopropyltransferase [Caldicoprobacter oshimai]|uniref:Polyamine aminopropyltransferase n=1 Tax=Caldicoprobacter faecalis TaxID=937334 RepID=A0A1I5U9V2_9FIRM|nr:polyamine aminopropyltransferase [Caldicoprobacter faecalis]PZN10387.1 MAG: polyamine aminopropyltransferase [Caldicoprobacter oshimai]SFP92035.1 spermidine synthase [Caldicoprobacter faecalis]
MELWYTEKQTPNVGITCKTISTLVVEKTNYQELAIIDTVQYGRMLVLNGMVQTTVKDEFVYHEMITHIPLFTHPNPKTVAVIGGGDGGTVREALKHPSVEKVYLVEIDERVVENSKRYLPEISCGLSDPRCEVLFQDGIEFIAQHENSFDVVLVDSTEPIGPATGLFSKDFYSSIYRALKEDGLFVAQTESPFFNAELIRSVYASIKQIFPVTRLYLASIPTYPSGLWSFTLGSKRYDPLEVDEEKILEIDTKYYSPEIHKSVFKLPRFVKNLLESCE